MDIRLGAALTLALALLGCKETTSSEFIKTGGIAMLADVTADSDKESKVHVDLRVGGDESNTYVILEGGDKLTARSGAEAKDLVSISGGVYEAKFATGAAADFTVNLDRAEEEDAPNSKGSLPEPFDITGPVAADERSREMDDVVVTWSPIEAEGTIRIDGNCIFTDEFPVSGFAGSHTIAKGEITSLDKDKPESCTVNVLVTLSKEGTPDPALDDESYFRAHQVRTTTFKSNP